MNITVTFDEPTLQSLLGLIDAGVRATGMQSVHAAANIDSLLGQAMRAAQAAPVEAAPAPASDADIRAKVAKEAAK